MFSIPFRRKSIKKPQLSNAIPSSQYRQHELKNICNSNQHSVKSYNLPANFKTIKEAREGSRPL